MKRIRAGRVGPHLRRCIAPRSFGLLAALVCLADMYGCTDRWDGFVYPRKQNLSEVISSGEFSSLNLISDEPQSAEWTGPGLAG